MIDPDRKPLYIPWSEEEFRGDLLVGAMTSTQRWIYRTLLQAAFFHSTRPYLPDNDSTLWLLAGCESQQQWQENKEVIRNMFTPVEIEGVHLLSQKRLLADWNYLMTKREEYAQRAQRAANAAWANRRNAPSTLEDATSMPGHTQARQAKGKERKKKGEDTLISGASVCQELVAYWNSNRGVLPEVSKITESRSLKIASRIKADSHFPEAFKDAVRKAATTPFCTGGGGHGWRASFDWLIENDRNYLAVLEGKYASKGQNLPSESNQAITVKDIRPPRSRP